MSLSTWLVRLPQPIARQLYPFLHYANLMRAIELRHLAPRVRDVEGWQVLDVGCGFGFYSLDFALRGAQLIGCDLSMRPLRAALETARGLGLADRTTYMAANGSCLPLPSGRFDLIFCNCVLEHVADDRAALAEMHRTLRPGGLLYLTVDNADHDLALSFLDRLPSGVRKCLLRPEVTHASTVGQGLNDYLAEIFDVRRRYHRQAVEATLEELGFEVLAQWAYLSRLSAAHYEFFNLFRGVNPRHGIGRLMYMLSSFVLYPFAAAIDTLQRDRGYGLMFTVRKKAS